MSRGVYELILHFMAMNAKRQGMDKKSGTEYYNLNTNVTGGLNWNIGNQFCSAHGKTKNVLHHYSLESDR
jgi:hypothetical protein